MGKSLKKLDLYDKITGGRALYMYKRRKLGETYEKLFHLEACLRG